MILHLISSALPLDRAQAGIVQPGDGMVFLADGVLSLLNTDNKNLATLPPSTRLYAIEDDMETRGLSNQATQFSALPNQPKIITYTEFVELTLQYNQTLSW